MKRAEYERAKEKIEAEYKKNLEALEIVWRMIGEDQDAPNATPGMALIQAPAKTTVQTEMLKPTMGDLVSEVLPEIQGDVSQPIVYNKLKERFSWIGDKHKAYIAGVLTDLTKKDPPVLQLITKANAGRPSVFRKVSAEDIKN